MRKFVEYDDGVTIRIWKSDTDPLDDVLFLMNESSEAEITEEWLENKLSWGRGGIAVIAYDETVPIGLVLFGSAPYVEFMRPTNVLLALYNYVSSEYRGRGVYNRLLTIFDEACKAEGFDLALVYPNHMARPAIKKNHWSALSPMQAYVHIPLSPRLGRMFTRVRRLWNSRNEEFVPIQSHGIDHSELDKFLNHPIESQRLQFAPSPAALKYRFNTLRGPGYHAIHGESVSAIVRVGWRGSISEVQFMAAFPSRISAKGWRELLRLIKASYAPDMVSRIESTRENNAAVSLVSGFLKLRQVTIPFWKSYQGRPALDDPILAGIDIHTW